MRFLERRGSARSTMDWSPARLLIILVMVCGIQAILQSARTENMALAGNECLAIDVPGHPLAALCAQLPATHGTPVGSYGATPMDGRQTIPPFSPATVIASPLGTPPDSDGDGLDDREERMFGTDPNLVDTDGDGLSDTTEILGIGTNPLRADTDGDGLTDGVEVASGSDPNDPLSPSNDLPPG